MSPERVSQWVSMATRGDQDAFAELVAHHAPALVRYLSQILKDREVAEELAQETFVRAYHSLDRLRDPQRFRHWLFRIARFAAIDCLRQAGRGQRARPDEVPSEALDAREAPLASVEQRMDLEALLARTRTAVEALPATAREIIMLRYESQCSYQEIGERLGLSLIQVKARLARARARLRGSLRPIAAEWKRLRDEMP